MWGKFKRNKLLIYRLLGFYVLVILLATVPPMAVLAATVFLIIELWRLWRRGRK